MLPFGSWKALHTNDGDLPVADSNSHGYCCPQCAKSRGEPSPHARKLFLVAERLSWEDGTVSRSERFLTEGLVWEINYRLGITEPVMLADESHTPGGTCSKENEWHPFHSEEELDAAMELIERADCLSSASWALWLTVKDYTLGLHQANKSTAERNVEEDVHISRIKSANPADTTLPTPPASGLIDNEDFLETFHLEGLLDEVDETPHVTILRHAKKMWMREIKELSSSGLASKAEVLALHPFGPRKGHLATVFESMTPPSPPVEPPQPDCVITFRTLMRFYELLDKIERTSYVGARFLETYAEYLTKDVCGDCWANHYIEEIPETAKPSTSSSQEVETKQTSAVSAVMHSQEEPHTSREAFPPRGFPARGSRGGEITPSHMIVKAEPVESTARTFRGEAVQPIASQAKPTRSGGGGFVRPRELVILED